MLSFELTTYLRRTPTNIRINLIQPECRVTIGYIFIADGSIFIETFVVGSKIHMYNVIVKNLSTKC